MKPSMNLQMIVLAFFASLLSSQSSASYPPPPPPPPAQSSSSSLVSTAARPIFAQQSRKTEPRRLPRQNWTRPPPPPPSPPPLNEGRHQEWRQRRRDLRVFKAAVLRILGLASEPKAGDGRRRRRMVPGYMWELYERMAKRNRESKAAVTRRPAKVTKRDGKRAPFDADTVRCFNAIDAESVDSNNTVRFSFDLSKDLEQEHFNGAELRLFRRPTDVITAERERYKISVYHVLPVTSPTDAAVTSSTRLLEVKVVDPAVRGWESFDVSAGVRTWKTTTTTIFGLEVKVTTTDDRPLEVNGVIIDVDDRKDGPEATGPLLVTYGDDRKQRDDDDDVISGRQNRDRLRHRNRSGRIRKRASSTSSSASIGRRKKPPTSSGGRSLSHCRRRPLYIDFKELEWNDWIFAPPGYDAFVCNGSCPVVLPEHLNSTNHAQIQSLLHSVDRTLVPPPCCVPTALSPIAMLYVNEIDRVVLKNYENMVVDACGCR